VTAPASAGIKSTIGKAARPCAARIKRTRSDVHRYGDMDVFPETLTPARDNGNAGGNRTGGEASQKGSVSRRLLFNLWKSKKIRWRLARIILLSCLGLLMAIKVLEDRLIFFPSKYPEGRWNIASQRAREGEYFALVQDCWVTASDRTSVHGWMCSPQQMAGGGPVAIPTDTVLLFFHGNAGNITDRYELMEKLVRIPARVFIIDYRGYGKSHGHPSEQGVYLDAEAAWKYLTETEHVSASDIVLFGESLGGAVAIDLGVKVRPGGLIAQSTFTSIPDMAGTIIPHLPPGFAGVILHTKMDSINKIGAIDCPKLFIHSRGDDLVPFAFGRRLFDAAKSPKQFYEVVGAAHNETDIIGGAGYFDAVAGFVRGLREGKVKISRE
jgi:fermentation-respiration switch protein FrsA (DUF1100 family)